MDNRSVRRFFYHLESSLNALKIHDYHRRLDYGIFSRFQSDFSKADDAVTKSLREAEDSYKTIATSKLDVRRTADSGLSKYSSVDDNLSDNKWKIELAWLSRALEPALQLCRRALPGGNDDGRKPLPNTSLSEIVSSIQRSKIGIQDWSLSDLTVGLFLIYLRQASADQIEDIEGTQISCDSTVENFIYHVELAKGAYRENAAGLAKNSMLREHNVLKFIKNSSVMRPGYYIGIDHRNKLIILGIRGTHTVYDLITDILSSSEREVSFEGYSTHFGTAEAARWFLNHEIDTIRKCISKHEGFKLRLVGHSLGGATASLLAIMLRKIPKEELGFSPDIVTAVGFATPPCVSKKLAESCSDYVSTIVMQDDIIPRLSVSSLKSLRNEILHTDWSSVLEKEDWKSVIDVLANAKQVVSSVQDVARKLADFASFRNKETSCDCRCLFNPEFVSKENFICWNLNSLRGDI
ncbi:hypothetical protein Scep_009916 [Stephania cephalantha]|uniref:Fungal lipase-type domain-containing protein n=1 Tax=Stephania cephalantha TaxID=152367 RepID=A0AAP0JWA9_9MAGN